MKKKLLILTMILFVLINVTSFAGDEIPLPDGLRQYYVIFYVDDGRYYLATSDTPFVYDHSRGQLVNYTDGQVYSYWTEKGGDEFYYYSSGINWSRATTGYYQLIASSHDIYYGTRQEMGTSVFFSPPPQPTPLRAVMEGMDFGMILRTFSAGLIPLVGLILLVISLQKGWGFLRNQLMH